MKSKIIVIFSLCSLFLGCIGSVSPPPSPEVRARVDFANSISENYPYRVSFSAQGNNKEILDITVIEEVPPYKVSDMVKFIVSNDLKQKAKALKFTQIHIEGGRKSFGDPDTINRTIDLR